MKAQTGEGDVDAGLRAAVGGGRHGAADGLEDEGDDVARDEDVVEVDGVEAGGFAREVVDDLVEFDVDGGAEEDGPDGDEDDLHDEARVVPRVLVHDDPPDVADDLVDAAEHHGAHKAPCPVFPGEADL